MSHLKNKANRIQNLKHSNQTALLNNYHRPLEHSTLGRSNFPPRALLRATRGLRTAPPHAYIYI